MNTACSSGFCISGRVLELENEIKGMEQQLHKTNMLGAPVFGEKMLINVYKVMKTRDNLWTVGAHIQDLVGP